jgi:hypothetical protein
MVHFVPTHRFAAVVTAGNVGALYQATAMCCDAAMIAAAIAGKGAPMPI